MQVPWSGPSGRLRSATLVVMVKHDEVRPDGHDATADDAGDLALIRAALRLTPAERLARVVATYPLVRAGLLHRRAADGDPRP